jgi:hypothetical protein
MSSLHILHYYYSKGDLGALEGWLNLLNYTKIPESLEFYINYYVLLFKLKICENAIEVILQAM